MLLRLGSTLVLWSLVIYLVLSEMVAGVFILSALMGVLAQWEFYTLQERKGWKVFKKAGVAIGLFFFLCLWFQLAVPEASKSLWRAMETLPLLLVILGAVSRQVFEKDQKTAVVTIALTLFGFFYAPFLFSFLIKAMFWSSTEGIYLAVYVVAVTKLTDAGAYAVGSLLGRKPLIPRISPKKTWEGFIGGLVIAVAASVLMVHFMGDRLDVLSGAHAWILGILISLISVVGDLAESVLKRDADSKDSGGLIPGIGGILDLIDSLLFTAPVFFFYLLLFCTP